MGIEKKNRDQWDNLKNEEIVGWIGRIMENEIWRRVGK